jgi:hypothetical protein
MARVGNSQNDNISDEDVCPAAARAGIFFAGFEMGEAARQKQSAGGPKLSKRRAGQCSQRAGRRLKRKGRQWYHILNKKS